MLKEIFLLIRTLYLSGEFNGSKDQIMETFNEVKNIINDTTFDAIYMHNLLGLDAKIIEEKLLDIMNFSTITEMRETNKDPIEDYDKRINGILNALEILYQDNPNMEVNEMLERLFIKR